MNFEGTGKNILADLGKLFIGERLGAGVGREVYVNLMDEDTVIKYEPEGFQNIKEWEMWQEVEMTKYAKWFAPCITISPNGIFLVQKRTYKPLKVDYPEKVPSFFMDKKYDNYGVIIEKGIKKFVCHDYGSFSLINGLNNRLVNADWWE